MNMMADGISMLDAARKASMSSDAVYSRGGESVTVAAAQGNYQYEAATEGGAIVTAHVLDFVVTAADLLLGDAVVEPMVGDLITVNAKTYEVLDLAGGGAWRWSGPPGTAIRIHTKEITPQ